MKEWKKPQISNLNLESTKEGEECPGSKAKGIFDITCCYHYCKKCGGCKNSNFNNWWLCKKACTCVQGS